MTGVLVRAGIVGGLLAALVASVLFWSEYLLAAGRAEVRAEWTAAALVAAEAARAKEAGWQAQLRKANQDAQIRQSKLALDAATARRAADGLLGDLAAIRAILPGLAADARAELAAVSTELLAVCTDRYQGISAEADTLWSDRQALIDAWPDSH